MNDSPAKIPYIQRVTSPDGKVRLYFRKGDHREGPLMSPDGSPELRAEIDAILKALSKRLKAPAVVQGSVGGMVLAYAGDGEKAKPSAAFRGLAAHAGRVPGDGVGGRWSSAVAG